MNDPTNLFDSDGGDQSALRSSNLSATADADTAANSSVLSHRWVPSIALDYPHDFLNPQTGLGPKDASQAEALWCWRKSRPPKGTAVDPDPPNGKLMLQEIRRMSDRLKTHIEQTFWACARTMAKTWNLKIPSTNTFPQTTKDFVKALSALERVEGSIDNETSVYMVCHHFHHQREWLSNAVDAWCLEEQIKIEFHTVPNLVGGVPKTHPLQSGWVWSVCQECQGRDCETSYEKHVESSRLGYFHQRQFQTRQRKEI